MMQFSKPCIIIFMQYYKFHKAKIFLISKIETYIDI